MKLVPEPPDNHGPMHSGIFVKTMHSQPLTK